MAIIITKKIRTILLIVLGVLVMGGGGFLFWRINQEDTVAPEDSEASCPSGCNLNAPLNVCTGPGGCVLNTHDGREGNCLSGEFATGGFCCDICDSATTPPAEGVGRDCDCGTDSKYCATCGDWASCVAAFGDCGCHGWGDQYNCDQYGKCGTRNTGDYPFTRTSWPSGTFCERGTVSPSSPAFPSAGGSTTWRCVGVTGVNKTIATCSASRKAAPRYTVTYDGNGGTCTPATRSVTHGTASAAPTCTRDSYNLAGFQRTAGGNKGNLNTATGRVGNVTGAQTIQAQWSESCGDGTCAADENVNNCPVDCPAVCGDNYCTHDETALSCPEDCEANCGDGSCTHDETALSCPEDCDNDCGDGLCTGDETPLSCPADCESECGDGYCTEGEDSSNCPEDCGENPIQGGTVPQTGILDTVLGRVSLGVSFIFLGGIVSQYSRLNYFFNSISERNSFKKEIKRQRRKERRISKSREKLEDRFE